MEGGCEDTYNDNLWGTNCNNLVYTLKQAALCCCNSHESDGRNCSYHSVTRRELEKCVGLFMISVTEMETVSHILRANCKAELKSAAIFSLLFQLYLSSRKEKQFSSAHLSSSNDKFTLICHNF